MRSVGGEMLHKFKFKMNLPDTFPEKFQMYADEGYKILKQKKSLTLKLNIYRKCC